MICSWDVNPNMDLRSSWAQDITVASGVSMGHLDHFDNHVNMIP